MYRVGILNSTQVFRSGGMFHYMRSLLEGLKNIPNLEVVVFYYDPAFQKFCFDSPSYKWVLMPGYENILSKSIRWVSTLVNVRSPLLGHYGVLRGEKLDILISFESLVGFHLRIPFISFIGDVMYKYYRGMPEYRLKDRVGRGLSTKRLAKHSVFTVVDSEESKEDLVKFYKVEAEKIKPIPLCAPPHIYEHRNLEASYIQEVVDKHHVPQRFIFYPAQFWYHKNHLRLIQSLDLLRKKYHVEIPAVFVGSSWHNLKRVLDLTKELRMGNQVFCLGYLPEKEIVALYKRATALVFASVADYTNIPVLEAMVLGTPVVCSNLFSMPEQVGAAGLLFDPFTVEDMAEKIYKIWTDEGLREELTAKGYKRAAELSLENFGKRWKALIEEAAKNSIR